jgi:hypothetical protein
MFRNPGSCGFVVWFSPGSSAKHTTKKHEHKTPPHEGTQVDLTLPEERESTITNR